jgi:hypothetical protein
MTPVVLHVKDDEVNHVPGEIRRGKVKSVIRCRDDKIWISTSPDLVGQPKSEVPVISRSRPQSVQSTHLSGNRASSTSGLKGMCTIVNPRASYSTLRTVVSASSFVTTYGSTLLAGRLRFVSMGTF